MEPIIAGVICAFVKHLLNGASNYYLGFGIIKYMKQSILKEDLDRLSEIDGEARGMAIKGEAEYILKTRGKEGLNRLEKELASIGSPIEYKKIKPMNFYPVRYEALTSLVLDKVFNFEDEDFRKVGKYETRVSFILRMFLKYFYSLRKVKQEGSNIWRKYYTIGNLSVVELDEKNKRSVLRIYDFYHYPKFCRTLEGFIGGLVGMIVKSEATCREVKCIYQGDEYHEFLVEW